MHNDNRYSAADLMPDDALSRTILQMRAKKIAYTQPEKTKEQATVPYIHFKLGLNEHYGIPYQYITEVIDNATLTTLPFTENYVSGIINRRGKLLAVINLRKFFQLSDTADNHSNNINIIIVKYKALSVGIVANYIIGSDAYNIDTSRIPYDGIIDTKYIAGLHGGKTAILNVETIILELEQRLNRTF